MSRKTRRTLARNPPSMCSPMKCDPRKERLEKTCANCTLNCDASIKFACSKFPKPCYESVNFEICCRSIIMDGFRYNCAGFGLQSAGSRAAEAVSKARMSRERLLQSKRLTSCNANSHSSYSGCRRWGPSASLCPISVSVSVSVSASASVSVPPLLLLPLLW